MPSNSFQDPLIRPDINLPLIGMLVLLGLPLVLLVMVLAKQPETTAPAAPLFQQAPASHH